MDFVMTQYQYFYIHFPLIVFIIKVFDATVIAIDELSILKDDIFIKFYEILVFYSFVLFTSNLDIVQVLNIEQILDHIFVNLGIIFKLVASDIQLHQFQILKFQKLTLVKDLVTIQVQKLQISQFINLI